MILMTCLFVVLMIPAAYAIDVTVADSKDWVDVYSVLLHGTLEGDSRVTFLNSESMTGFVRTVSEQAPLIVYESSDSPYINNLADKLEAAGYDVIEEQESDSFNLDLDPRNGRYFVMSEDYYRISVSIAPVAIKENRWVLVANADTIDEIADRLEDADSVVAVGNFRRDLLSRIEGSFDEWITYDSIFVESQELAKRYGDTSNIVLADGFSLEAEFFAAETPVLLTGSNRVIEDTLEWVSDNDVRNVVVIGNKLAVVGEQIREQSNESIGVFIKFGQSDTQNSGRIYALTMFPLPQPLLGLTVQRAIYDPEARQLVAYIENIGNIGLYETTTISIKNGETEIGSASDDGIIYIGTGEVLAQVYDIDLPFEDLTDDTVVEFFTSFGLSPAELDSFLTMENRYGPPFTIPLTIDTIDSAELAFELIDVAYYTSLNRVGVTVLNNGTETVHYNIKIRDLIVNGLEEELFKQDSVRAGEEKITYLPVSLDEIDQLENEEFVIDIVYGSSPQNLLNRISETRPFETRAGGLLSALAIGGTGAAIGGLVALLLVAALAMFLYVRSQR